MNMVKIYTCRRHTGFAIEDNVINTEYSTFKVLYIVGTKQEGEICDYCKFKAKFEIITEQQ
jgi:hypothetical protein